MRVGRTRAVCACMFFVHVYLYYDEAIFQRKTASTKTI